MIAIAAGTLIRSLPGDSTLLAGTTLLGCAIAVGTVLVPATITAEQAHRRGALTGVYTMALSIGPALALGLTVPMMNGTGLQWRGTLALWSLIGVVALALWLAYTRSTMSHTEPIPSRGTGAPHTAAASGRPQSTVKDLRVWRLALYLGITSLTFYTTSAWLPTTFIVDGLPAAAAGGYTSLLNLVAIPFAFLAPIGMQRGWSRVLSPLSPLVAVAGVVLLLTAGSAAALPVCLLLGVAQGLCLGVSYNQVVQYATSPGHAASVSALTSTVGIAIAAIGPLVFGFGMETSGTYVLPMSGLGAVIVIQAAVGLASGRPSPARDRT